MMNFDDLNLTNIVPEVKQSDTIKYILEKGPNPDMELLKNQYKKVIGGGICYMLSMEWLRLIITRNEKWKNHFGRLTEGSSDKDVIYYKQVANNYFAFASSDLGLKNMLTNTANYNDIRVDKEFVKLCTGGNADVNGDVVIGFEKEENVRKNREKCADAMAGTIMNAKEKFFFIRLDMEYVVNNVTYSVAHQVAIYKENDLTLYFYDPNIGTIEVKANSKIPVLTKLSLLLRVIWSEFYAVNKAYVRFVEEKEVKKNEVKK